MYHCETAAFAAIDRILATFQPAERADFTLYYFSGLWRASIHYRISNDPNQIKSLLADGPTRLGALNLLISASIAANH